MLQQVVGLLGSLMVIAALFLLWWKSRSVWLLVSIVAQGIGLLLHAAFAVVPTAFTDTPMVFSLWGLCGLTMAAGLLGYAVTETTRTP